MAPFGDTPFDFNDYAFTVAEAADVAGVAELDLRNWMRRGITTMGKKNRLKRIMFNAKDIVALRVVGDLNRLLRVEPSMSLPIAARISEHFSEWMMKENRHLHEDADGHRVETRLIVHLAGDPAYPAITPFQWGESVFGFKVAQRGEEHEWTRHPFIVLPVEQIFGDVLEQLFAILESEEK